MDKRSNRSLIVTSYPESAALHLVGIIILRDNLSRTFPVTSPYTQYSNHIRWKIHGSHISPIRFLPHHIKPLESLSVKQVGRSIRQNDSCCIHNLTLNQLALCQGIRIRWGQQASRLLVSIQEHLHFFHQFRYSIRTHYSSPSSSTPFSLAMMSSRSFGVLSGYMSSSS